MSSFNICHIGTTGHTYGPYRTILNPVTGAWHLPHFCSGHTGDRPAVCGGPDPEHRPGIPRPSLRDGDHDLARLQDRAPAQAHLRGLRPLPLPHHPLHQHRHIPGVSQDAPVHNAEEFVRLSRSGDLSGRHHRVFYAAEPAGWVLRAGVSGSLVFNYFKDWNYRI